MGIGLPRTDEKVDGLRTDARKVASGTQRGPHKRGATMNAPKQNSLCMVIYDHDKAVAKGFAEQDMFEWIMVVEDWLYGLGAATISKGVGYGEIALGIKNAMGLVVYWNGEIPSDTLLADIVMKESMKAPHAMRIEEHDLLSMKAMLSAWRYRDLNNLNRYKAIADAAFKITDATGLRANQL